MTDAAEIRLVASLIAAPFSIMATELQSLARNIGQANAAKKQSAAFLADSRAQFEMLTAQTKEGG